MSGRVTIKKLASGVPGLDDVLGGGLPEFSFNLIAGGPGCGKTTLAHQLAFAGATAERPALYVTVVGEPPIKMLRYQQQFTFFDVDKVSTSIRFLHLGDVLLERGLGGVLDEIARELEATRPGVVVVDSFRSVDREAKGNNLETDHFVQRLALMLTSWEATTFLVGEYAEHDDSNSLFSVADGILWMYQDIHRHSLLRRMQVVKVRGQAPLPGMHTVTITDDGVRVFPRALALAAPALRHADDARRSCGVPALDLMLGGGIPAGFALVVAGPTGTGKSTLATQFVVDGCARGERAVLALFERRPADLGLAAALRFEPHLASGALQILPLSPSDRSVDETLAAIRDAVRATGARRLAIDSLAGFELALAPAFRDDFREALYRVIGELIDQGVTVVLTADTGASHGLPVTDPRGVSFLADGIVALSYVELDARLRRAITVLKMRGGEHSKDIRSYDIDASGLVIGPPFAEYDRLTSGWPTRR